MSTLFKLLEKAVGELTLAPLEAGVVAPDFTLLTELGAPVRLYDLRGRPVVLVFYPADDTPTCSEQLSAFNEILPRLEAVGGRVLGINPGGAESHQRFRERLDLGFDLLVDPGARVARAWRSAWGPSGRPRRTVYAVTPGGRIAFAERGTPSPERVIRALGLWAPPPKPQDEGVPVSELIQIKDPSSGTSKTS